MYGCTASDGGVVIAAVRPTVSGSVVHTSSKDKQLVDNMTPQRVCQSSLKTREMMEVGLKDVETEVEKSTREMTHLVKCDHHLPPPLPPPGKIVKFLHSHYLHEYYIPYSRNTDVVVVDITAVDTLEHEVTGLIGVFVL
jgi:hypothetical protein